MEEFEAYVQARSAALARTAYLLTGDVQHAEDLLQDTLSRVAERWEAVVRNGDPEAYVRKVMYHRAVDVWRRRRHAEVSTGSVHEHEELVRRDTCRHDVGRRRRVRDRSTRRSHAQAPGRHRAGREHHLHHARVRHCCR